MQQRGQKVTGIPVSRVSTNEANRCRPNQERTSGRTHPLLETEISGCCTPHHAFAVAQQQQLSTRGFAYAGQSTFSGDAFGLHFGGPFDHLQRGPPPK